MKQQYSIGRNPDNHIVIPNPAVSGSHADLIVSDDNGFIQYMFVDHSTNGTMINGQMLHQSSCYVAYNDVIIFPGNIMFDWTCLSSANFVVPHTESVLNTPAAGLANLQAQQANLFNNAYSGVNQYQNTGAEEITFLNVMKRFFVHYADFSGRARRREYWFVNLWMMIINSIFVTISIAFMAGGTISVMGDGSGSGLIFGIALSALYGIWGLAIFVPSLALTVRRIHDMGKSGWFFCMIFIPLVGFIFPFVWGIVDSVPGPNQYGPSQK